MNKNVKRLLKITGYALLSFVLLVLIGFAYMVISSDIKSRENLSKPGAEAKVLRLNDFAYRDLKKNEKLDIFEDSRHDVLWHY